MIKPQSIAGRASGVERRRVREIRRQEVAAYLAARPDLTTDELAEILGFDRSTIRRDRKKIGLVVARARTGQ